MTFRITAAIFALTALFCAWPAPTAATPDGQVSLMSFLNDAPAVSGDLRPIAADDDGGGEKKPLSIRAGFRMVILGREIKATHVAGRPLQWAGVWNSDQANQDAEWFVVHRYGAIRLGGDYILNEQIKLSGGVLLGANASTLEYRVGPGNDNGLGATDTSIEIDTEVGFYPLDMFYGLEVEGCFAMQDFQVGARYRMTIASAPFDEHTIWYDTVEGWYTIWVNELAVVGKYKTPYGTPRLGVGISLYKAWSHQEEVASATPVDYHFLFRETQFIQFLVGHTVETKEGWYMSLEFQIIGPWGAEVEVGYKFM